MEILEECVINNEVSDKYTAEVRHYHKSFSEYGFDSGHYVDYCIKDQGNVMGVRAGFKSEKNLKKDYLRIVEMMEKKCYKMNEAYIESLQQVA